MHILIYLFKIWLIIMVICAVLAGISEIVCGAFSVFDSKDGQITSVKEERQKRYQGNFREAPVGILLVFFVALMFIILLALICS